MSHATARFETARVFFDQRAVNSVAIPLQVTGKIPEQFLGVFLAATRMKLKDHVPTWLAGQPQIAGRTFAFDFRVHHLDWRLIDLQVIPSQ